MQIGFINHLSKEEGLYHGNLWPVVVFYALCQNGLKTWWMARERPFLLNHNKSNPFEEKYMYCEYLRKRIPMEKENHDTAHVLTPLTKRFNKFSKNVLVLGKCHSKHWKNIIVEVSRTIWILKDCFSVKNTYWNNLVRQNILKKLIMKHTDILKYWNSTWNSWNHSR